MKALSLPRYGPLGASSRVRFRQYYGALMRMVPLSSIEESPLLDDDYLRCKYARRRMTGPALRGYCRRLARLASVRAADHVYWVEKELFPWAPFWMEAALLRRPYLLDLDDAIFHNYDLHPLRAVRALYARKIDRLMRGAALVTAGNEYLAARARAAGAPWVEVLPTVVDLDHYPLRARGPASEVLTVGWIGSPATVHYLQAIAQPLRRLSEERRLRLCVIGGGEARLLGVEVETVEWSAQDESRAIARFDIGVMPLADSPWERGKCGYKLIQYMACGVPVVASPVGVNAALVSEGENGYLAADDDAWYRALARLGSDAALRARLGAAGRRLVEREYCLQVTAPRLARWLQAVAERRKD